MYRLYPTPVTRHRLIISSMRFILQAHTRLFISMEALQRTAQHHQQELQALQSGEASAELLAQPSNRLAATAAGLRAEVAELERRLYQLKLQLEVSVGQQFYPSSLDHFCSRILHFDPSHSSCVDVQNKNRCNGKHGAQHGESSSKGQLNTKLPFATGLALYRSMFRVASVFTCDPFNGCIQ